MARKAPAPPPPLALDDDDDDAVVVSPEMGSLMDFLDRAGEKGESVAIFELNKDTKEQEFLERVPKEQFSFEFVRDQYGGGHYVALCTDVRNRIVSRATFAISPRWKGKVSASAVPVIPGATADPAALIALAQMQGANKGLEAIAASQAQVLGAVLTALTGRGADRREEKDPLDVGLRIAEIIKGASAPAGSVSEMVETFREGLKLGATVAGPGEKGFWDVVEPLVAPAADVLKTAMATERRPAGAAPVAAKPLPPGGTPPMPSVDLTKAPWLVHLGPFVPEIAAWAQRGFDPEALAVSIAARLPDAACDELEAAAKAPDFITRTLAALPAPFQGYTVYLTKALQALVVQVQSDHDDDEAGAETPVAP